MRALSDLQLDYQRYAGKKEMPRFQYYYRKSREATGFLKLRYRLRLKQERTKNCVDLGCDTKIGGLYIGHPYAITVNPKATLGCNCNLHKGVTIGQENRGRRRGAPTIGNCVWIGVNATVVGNITVGDDVLIAPNTYVNCDIPSHSVVFGNPCVIKPRENATEEYINRKCDHAESKC